VAEEARGGGVVDGQGVAEPSSTVQIGGRERRAPPSPSIARGGGHRAGDTERDAAAARVADPDGDAGGAGRGQAEAADAGRDGSSSGASAPPAHAVMGDSAAGPAESSAAEKEARAKARPDAGRGGYDAAAARRAAAGEARDSDGSHEGADEGRHRVAPSHGSHMARMARDPDAAAGGGDAARPVTSR
jgi:hypothetical protein